LYDYYLPCISETSIKINKKEEKKAVDNNLFNKFIGITSRKRSYIIKSKT